MAAPEPGTTLAGKYVVERVLGVGGMGVVVAARHIQLDQKVAIKYLLPDALANPEVVERFGREARAAAKIRGEHVARVIDVGNFDDGAPFMVLEYLEGENLEELLERRGPLPIAEAVGYVLETCEALAEAHSAGVVHRDLKPANLFLARQPDRRSIVKVLDFGISKLVDPSGNGITKTSSIMGTPYYMSPEQLIASKGVDARSDIWALGVILYELITNRKPFGGESIAEIIGGILQNEPERVSVLRSDVTLDFELCIARCLASKPANRHASVGELALALAPFAAIDQRSTIEKIARVLGDSLAPPRDVSAPDEAAPASLVIDPAPPSGFASTAIVDSAPRATSDEVVATGAAVATKPPAATAAPAVAAVTAHAVASGVDPTPAKRSPILMIAVAVALAAAAMGAFWGMHSSSTTKTPTAHDPVGVPSTVISASASASAATAATPPSTVASTSLLPLAVDPPVADAAVGSAVPQATSRRETPPGGSTSRITPRPSASQATAASAPPVTPPASAAKNPLQMGIK